MSYCSAVDAGILDWWNLNLNFQISTQHAARGVLELQKKVLKY